MNKETLPEYVEITKSHSRSKGETKKRVQMLKQILKKRPSIYFQRNTIHLKRLNCSRTSLPVKSVDKESVAIEMVPDLYLVHRECNVFE